MAENDNDTVREKETVVVTEGGEKRSGPSTGLIVGLIILFILAVLFVLGNPFAESGGSTDVNVQSPAPTNSSP